MCRFKFAIGPHGSLNDSFPQLICSGCYGDRFHEVIEAPPTGAYCLLKKVDMVRTLEVMAKQPSEAHHVHDVTVQHARHSRLRISAHRLPRRGGQLRKRAAERGIM